MTFALSVNCLVPLIRTNTVSAQAVHAQKPASAGHQQWEYTVIDRGRGFKETDGVYKANYWEAWLQDGAELPSPVDMTKKLTQLGQEGWELVEVVPLSNYASVSLGGQTSTVKCLGTVCGNPTGASLSGYSMGGATDHEQWIFKRPKL